MTKFVTFKKAGISSNLKGINYILPFFFNSSYVWFDKIFLDQKIISNENIFKYLIVFRKMMWKTGDRQPMVAEVWTNVSQIQN